MSAVSSEPGTSAVEHHDGWFAAGSRVHAIPQAVAAVADYGGLSGCGPGVVWERAVVCTGSSRATRGAQRIALQDVPHTTEDARRFHWGVCGGAPDCRRDLTADWARRVPVLELLCLLRPVRCGDTSHIAFTDLYLSATDTHILSVSRRKFSASA